MKTRRADTARQCRPLEAWPPGDRSAWVAALAPRGPLDDAGPAADWAPRSAAKYATGYGRWLSFLDSRGWLDPDALPGARVSRERVAAYVAALKDRNGTYPVVCRLEELAAALRALAPAGDWRWLLRRAAGLRRGSASSPLPNTWFHERSQRIW
jgi:hypothetical protein